MAKATVIEREPEAFSFGWCCRGTAVKVRTVVRTGEVRVACPKCSREVRAASMRLAEKRWAKASVNE